MDLEKDAAETANIVLQADSQAGDKDFVTVQFLGRVQHRIYKIFWNATRKSLS